MFEGFPFGYRILSSHSVSEVPVFGIIFPTDGCAGITLESYFLDAVRTFVVRPGISTRHRHGP